MEWSSRLLDLVVFEVQVIALVDAHFLDEVLDWKGYWMIVYVDRIYEYHM
jgi:hypothetical protein